MRLIDADALEYEVCSGCEYYKNKYANCDDCAIAHAPTIDAVPVVKCKDCQYNEWCIPKQGRSENDYCSRGKRREP